MKSKLITLILAVICTSAFTQSAQNPLNITIGGGQQKYSGDLGKGFHHRGCCFYGGIGGSVSYYINNKFDIGIFNFVGDLSYVQPEEVANAEVAEELQCGGCIDRVGLGNLKSRVTTHGIFVKYKIGEFDLFKKEDKLVPYVYFGAAHNYVSDRMKMNCVNVGNYFTLNGGLGLKYQICERFSFGYNLAIGYFTNDKIDFIVNGSGDFSMQNTLTLGIDLF